MLLQRIGSDAQTMLGTISSFPYRARRVLFLMAISLVIIGYILFWPDLPATIGFSVGTVLLMYALVALTEGGFGYPFLGWDDPTCELTDELIDDEDEEANEWL